MKKSILENIEMKFPSNKTKKILCFKELIYSEESINILYPSEDSIGKKQLSLILKCRLI